MNHDVGVVVIGRNEGDRLRKCLESIVGSVGAVVYVDSGSSDDSVAMARSLGAEVVELDASSPFTAARGRNEGFARLREHAVAPVFVQFVDGDCELDRGWIGEARGILEARSDVAVVCGRRRELHPEASLYNRLADLEWDRPPGETESCGGDAIMRTEALVAVGGYDPTVAAGEEPELCFRLRRAGWKIVRVNAEMTRHDLAMTRFGQWWRRQVRSGRAALDVSRRCQPPAASTARQVRSTRIWTVGWLAVLIVASAMAWGLVGRWASLATASLVLLMPVAQALRMAVKERKRLRSVRDALAYGALVVVGKWAEITGQIQYVRDRATGRGVRLIEYKGADNVGSVSS